MTAYHPNYTDQRAAINWSREVLKRRQKYVILDTETTGLGKSDEIIQLAVVDLDGNVLFNENIKPTKKKSISSQASSIHKLTMSNLAECPTFSELKNPLKKAIGRRRIITYNTEFDLRLYKQTWQFAGGFLPKGQWECAMLQYAKYIGEWNDYYQNYRWQKLEGGDHSASGDCLATLKVIQTMASSAKLKKWYELWVTP